MILIFDASIEGFSVGLFNPEGALVAHIENDTPFSHTELLVPTIQEVLTQANVEFKDLTKVITTKGPGSFTGIRVGLATAAGLRAALNIPVVAVNTLSALVHSALHHHHSNATPRIHAVLDTKCGELYHQAFINDRPNILAEAMPQSTSLVELMLTVSKEPIITHPSSKPVLENIPCITVPLTLEGIWNAAQQTADEDLQPLYVRSANINPPKLHG
jgi:tRNA threonylcarbamoyl adenosine modification protein YeaZ